MSETLYARLDLSLRPEIKEVLKQRAAKCGLSLTRYLIACSEEFEKRRAGWAVTAGVED